MFLGAAVLPGLLFVVRSGDIGHRYFRSCPMPGR